MNLLIAASDTQAYDVTPAEDDGHPSEPHAWLGIKGLVLLSRSIAIDSKEHDAYIANEA